MWLDRAGGNGVAGQSGAFSAGRVPAMKLDLAGPLNHLSEKIRIFKRFFLT